MTQELTYEYRVLGGSVADAIMTIKDIDDHGQLEALLLHEQSHMNRKTIVKTLKRKLLKRLYER